MVSTVGLGRGLVLPGPEQQGHVHLDRGADALIDRGPAGGPAQVGHRQLEEHLLV